MVAKKEITKCIRKIKTGTRKQKEKKCRDKLSEEIVYRGHVFDYDSLENAITMDGEVVYEDEGIGEVNLRECAEGTETWEDGHPFTIDDFVTEIVIPMLEDKYGY